MQQVIPGAKVPVHISLGEDLLREAETLTSDLSGTVEELLTSYVAGERSKRVEENEAVDAVLAATRDFVDQYGLPGADFAPV